MSEKKTQTVAARDGCVVDGEPVAGMLNLFVDRWERTRPKSTGHRSGRPADEVTNVRALEWLSENSGVSEWTIKKVMTGDRETVDLGVADALVAAVGRPEAFYDGTLHVSCCGGSSRR